MRILGIETSCDETAAAVVDDGTLVRSNVIASQVALHQCHGGVVPELAARAQITAIVPVICEALDQADTSMREVDAIAFTNTPGLAGSLLVGANIAKAVGWSAGKPLIPVNHLEGHVHANWLYRQGQRIPKPAFPAVCLLVSGGHTELILMHSHNRYDLLGQTIDDAAGEAFDKGARLLGLGYPGGPAIQKSSASGDPHAFAFPRAQLQNPFDFSFSGLKTSLLRQVEEYRLPDSDRPRSNVIFPEHRPPRYREDLPLADLAASYQEAIIDVLSNHLVKAAVTAQARSVLIAGGVAANSELRARIRSMLPAGMSYYWPDFEYCTDNAAMIAGRAFHLAMRNEFGSLATDVYPRGSIPHAQ